MADDKTLSVTGPQDIIPEGPHVVMIISAQKTTSMAGNKMLLVRLAAYGYTQTIYHHIVFMEDRPEITNRNIQQFLDSFSTIPEGDFDTSHWKGHIGACYVKHDMYNGELRPKVDRFIPSSRRDEILKGACDIVRDYAEHVVDAGMQAVENFRTSVWDNAYAVVKDSIDLFSAMECDKKE